MLNQAGSDYFDCVNIEFNDFLLDRTCIDQSRRACLNELLRVRHNGSLRWRELRWAAAPYDVTQVLNPADFRVKLYQSSSSPLVDLDMLRERRTRFSRISKQEYTLQRTTLYSTIRETGTTSASLAPRQ